MLNWITYIFPYYQTLDCRLGDTRLNIAIKVIPPNTNKISGVLEKIKNL